MEREAAAAAIGWWEGNGRGVDLPVEMALARVHEPVFLFRHGNGYRARTDGSAVLSRGRTGHTGEPLAGYAPPARLEDLGDASFRREYGLRYAYLAGAMANGIGSVEIVEAMSRAGMLGFFGAAGLPIARIEAAIDRVSRSLGQSPFGFNLIHNPAEPTSEAAVVDLYLRKNVRLVEASAYLDLSLPVVRYRVHGIHRDASGKVVAPNKVIAKVSRVEVATRFLSPPPAKRLEQLVQSGDITEEQARLAQSIPMAQDLTAEADSGGHTDNRPAITLLPTMLALRDRLQAQFQYETPPRIGLGGGIATPASVAGALAMGAAYVLGGSIHQACVESGSSDLVRQMLAEAEQADVTMAPAADMFEMGVKVQVLKRGTMFAMRASKLFEIYRSFASIEEIPADQRGMLEKTFFRASLEEIWSQTRAFFEGRDPSQIQRAEKDPKHKMALVFRWYLGHSSRWANAGEEGRKIDFQVWCGPAMGAFNEWTKGSFLEQPRERKIVTVARNLIFGAAVLSRIGALGAQGVAVPAHWYQLRPLTLEELDARLVPVE